MQRNETDIVGGGGGFAGGGWGEGILGLIALLSLFRGNLFGGNHEAAQSNVAEMQNQLSDIRADIGSTKYDSARDILGQTNVLLQEMCNGKFQNAQAVWEQTNRLQAELFGIQKDILTSHNGIEKSILIQGFENRLANERQTYELSRQISDCCCSTNQNIERTAFATQLRDLEHKCSTDRQLEEIKCLIKDTAKEQELVALRRESERGFIAKEIEKATGASVGATLNFWWAQKSFNGATYPTPPYPYGFAV